jgi:uncharacterized membrane protein
MIELAIGLFIVLILVFVAQRWGASKEREKDASRAADVSKRMTDAAVNSPGTKSDVVERLRNKGF